MASDHIKHLNDDNFDQEIAHGIVLVDFYADWCGPCRMLAPVIDELAEETVGTVTVVKIDTDQAQNTATKYEVTSIPTLILFKDGEVKKKVVGLKDIDALRKMIASVG